MLKFFNSIYFFLNYIILNTSSSPIPIFYDRFCRNYGLRVCPTPFPLITLGLNARLGGPVTTAAPTTTTTQNTIINGTVPTNVNVVTSPIPPDVVTTLTTLIPINNVRIATFPTVSGALRSRVAQGSVVSVFLVTFGLQFVRSFNTNVIGHSN